MRSIVLGSVVGCVSKSREPSCVGRPGGSLRFPQLPRRAADAVGRAQSARRERPSRRLSLPLRRPAGPAAPLLASFASRFGLPACLLAGLLLACAGLFPAPALAQSETVVWTATMTVGEPTGNVRGFARYGPSNAEGSLTPESFTYPAGGTTYTVKYLYRAGASSGFAFGNAFIMRFENALTQDQQDQAANLVLEVAGERLALNDNTHDDNSPGWYSWNTAWLATNAASLNDATFETTLPDGADVTVRLLETSGDGNTAATGKPLIRGTPQVGQTLMARKGDMADDDDLPTTTFPTGYSFQWVRVGASNTETDINGATSQTYTATTAAVGNTIRVEVTFTDGGGTQETLESNATEAVVPAAGACPANNNWCAKLTVERSRLGTGTVYGFAHNDYGALDDKDIVHGATYQVRGLWIWDGDGGNDLVLFDFQSDRVPHGSEMNFGGTAFTASAAAEHPDHDTRYRWDRPADLAWIDGQEVTVSANLPPALESATVDGTTLVLTYVEDLDTGSTPAADAYSVTVNGTAAAPSDVSVAARTVTLIPATAVIDTDDVTVSYTRGNSPVQDVSGLDAPDFTDSAVTNNTGAVAPAPVSALVRAQGHIMILDFDEDLAQDNLPPADAFTVKADGDTVTVESVEFHVDNNALDKLRLNLPTAAIKENETVTVSYDVPTTNPLQDGDGNETMDFTDFPVTNNSTVVETRGAELTPPALEVNEGTTGSYTVVLTEAPTGSVTVTVAGASGTLLSVSPMTLVFTTSSWAVAQTVDVTTEEDANAVDETVTLTHTASGGGYDGVSLPDLEVTVADNDGGIVADPVELTVAEGGTGTYGLTLTRAPTSDVTVTVTGDAGKVTAAPSTLTFTADDWNAAQTVTVTGTQDGDKNDEAVTLRHAATGGGYTVASGDALSARVRVTVHDDETTAPGAPELDADSGYETALLRWSPPDDDGGAPVTGYEYRRGTGPAQATESLSAHTVHGLVNGTEYRFQVRAVNRIGEGAWSAAKTVTPVPLTLTVVAVSDEVVEGEPVRYRIEMSNETGWVEVGMAYRHEGEFMRSPRSSSIQGIRSRGGALAWERERATVDDTDIEAHGSFTVRLQPGAGYSVGSPWSATVRILDNDGGTLPGAPSRPSVSVVSPTMLGATWGSAAANGASVTGYELEYRAGVSGVWTRWGEAIAPGGRPVRLTGLSPGTEHEVRVRARNVRGAGPWSTTGGARTAPDPEVRVSLSAGTEVGAVEGATLEFTVAGDAGAGLGAAGGPSGDGDGGDARGGRADVGDGTGGAAFGRVRGEDPERQGGRGRQRRDGGAPPERALPAGRGACGDVQGFRRRGGHRSGPGAASAGGDDRGPADAGVVAGAGGGAGTGATVRLGPAVGRRARTRSRLAGGVAARGALLGPGAGGGGEVVRRRVLGGGEHGNAAPAAAGVVLPGERAARGGEAGAVVGAGVRRDGGVRVGARRRVGAGGLGRAYRPGSGDGRRLARGRCARGGGAVQRGGDGRHLRGHAHARGGARGRSARGGVCRRLGDGGARVPPRGGAGGRRRARRACGGGRTRAQRRDDPRLDGD